MYRLLNVKDVLKTEYASFFSMMSAEKRARVERLRFESDKRLTVCGELLARKMISEYCGVSPESITISVDDMGKPYAENLNVKFNISHSGDYVICAVGDNNVGADIELMREVNDSLIRFICTDEEAQYVCQSPENKLKRFFEVWTAKEAYFKCRGTGILDLKSVCILDDNIRSNLKTFFFGDYAVSIYEE